MKALNYKVFLFTILIFLLSGCNTSEISKAGTLQTQTIVTPKLDLSKIDLTQIKYINPQGRAQDGGLKDKEFNQLSIADDLIANGKDSIPYLIGKLDNETELDRSVINFWYKVYVGDVALIILNDLFTKDDGKTSTIKGFSWDDFLERGNDKDSMSEAILRNYIKKHGRKNIKARWQKVWDDNKENIFWDETERCFKVGKHQSKL